MAAPRVRLITFYLPQFHPIPENDKWWGRGFTEWTNVASAAPLFAGHLQPDLPAHLGFYDLRLAEARHAQADLAAEYGLHGFCYYHYWFCGKRLLERPFNEVLASGEPKFPFCLCWANETWSRRWLGEEQDILIRQTYSLDDDVRHARWLAQAFSDQRYITISGRPMFLIYRPGDLPQPERTTETLKRECVRAGVPEPYLVGVDGHSPGRDFRVWGFDRTLVFEPQLGVLPDFNTDGWTLGKLRRNLAHGLVSGRLKVYDCDVARHLMAKRKRHFPYIQSVLVGWDNTPRRGRDAIVVVKSTPESFERALAAAMDAARLDGQEDPIVFINGWNEWAEGNHLEPGQQYGLEFLKRVQGLSLG